MKLLRSKVELLSKVSNPCTDTHTCLSILVSMILLRSKAEWLCDEVVLLVLTSVLSV